MNGSKKFIEKTTTAKGEDRAFATFKQWKTLWINTGTLCNLECKNCYIESSPKNDSLSYITLEDVIPFLNEIKERKLPITRIGFTGGEPFINPHIISILEEVLTRGFDIIVLTNAYKVLRKHRSRLLELKEKYQNSLSLRVSLDHHTAEVHDKERGTGTFEGTFHALKWLNENNFNLSIGGRSLTGEEQQQAMDSYQQTLDDYGIALKLDQSNIVIFPEMDTQRDVPEITTGCWDILGKTPDNLMCTSERMIVKKKGQKKAQVQACTLLAHQEEFNMGSTLKESEQTIFLNHPFCAQFCVLGGASCSST